MDWLITVRMRIVNGTFNNYNKTDPQLVLEIEPSWFDLPDFSTHTIAKETSSFIDTSLLITAL